jgi:hypothetical protein
VHLRAVKNGEAAFVSDGDVISVGGDFDRPDRAFKINDTNGAARAKIVHENLANNASFQEEVFVYGQRRDFVGSLVEHKRPRGAQRSAVELEDMHKAVLQPNCGVRRSRRTATDARDAGACRQ